MLRHVAFFLRSFCKKQYSTPSCYVPHQLYNRNSRNTRADHTVFLLWYCDFQANITCQHINFYLSSYFMTELLWHRIYIYFSMSVSTIQWSCHNRPWYIPSNNGWDAREYFIPVLFFLNKFTQNHHFDLLLDCMLTMISGDEMKLVTLPGILDNFSCRLCCPC